jgi:hypothetical protein
VRLAKLSLVAGLAALIFAAALWAWLALPRLRHSTTQTFFPGELTSGSGVTLPGTWTLQVAAPRRIPLGESGTVRLTLSPAQTPSAGDLDPFLSYDLLIEARAEIPAAAAAPSGLSSQSLSPESPAEFEWRVRPQSAGTLNGRVWLYLRVGPQDGGEAVQRPVSVRAVTIESVTLFGHSARPIRVAASVSLWIGCALVLPYLLLRFRRRKIRDL